MNLYPLIFFLPFSLLPFMDVVFGESARMLSLPAAGCHDHDAELGLTEKSGI